MASLRPVCKPRCEAAITARSPDPKMYPVYLDGKAYAKENCTFLRLDYLELHDIRMGLPPADFVPILWSCSRRVRSSAGRETTRRLPFATPAPLAGFCVSLRGSSQRSASAPTSATCGLLLTARICALLFLVTTRFRRHCDYLRTFAINTVRTA